MNLKYATRAGPIRIPRAIAAVFGCIILSLAVRVDAIMLNPGQFVAEQGALSASAWKYTGTLPASFDAGFSAKSEESFCCCGTCDNQYTNGRRRMTSTVGSNPSYRLTLTGSFETPEAENWEGSLLDKSNGNTQTDIEDVDFPDPGSGITQEHPIPQEWRSTNGYGLPTESYAQFSRTYSLKSQTLDVGQFNCPQLVPGSAGTRTGFCIFDNTWTKIGANLEAGLTGAGSIENSDSSTESVHINAQANRITTFKINDQPLFSDTVTTSNTNFNLVEDRDNTATVNLTTSKQEAVATSTWNSKSDVASFDASYVHRAEMPDYVQVLASAEDYVVTVRDDPQLIAGISGSRFTTASVESYSGMAGLDVSILPVFEAIALDRVGNLVATATTGRKSLIPIPPGKSFTDPLSVPFHFVLSNTGGSDLTINSIQIELIDDDSVLDFFDDLLTSITSSLNILLHPNETTQLNFVVSAPTSKLNAAIDFLEGSELELAASAMFTFSDAFGMRTRDIDIVFAPEPSTWLIFLTGYAGLLVLDWRRRTPDTRCLADTLRHLET